MRMREYIREDPSGGPCCETLRLRRLLGRRLGARLVRPQLPSKRSVRARPRRQTTSAPGQAAGVGRHPERHPGRPNLQPRPQLGSIVAEHPGRPDPQPRPQPGVRPLGDGRPRGSRRGAQGGHAGVPPGGPVSGQKTRVLDGKPHGFSDKEWDFDIRSPPTPRDDLCVGSSMDRIKTLDAQTRVVPIAKGRRRSQG